MKSILDYSLKELTSELKKLDIPGYRAKQIFEWVYKKHVFDFHAMKNLPEALTGELEKKFEIIPLDIRKHLISKKDSTEKYLWELRDGCFIETVLIKTAKRLTVCVSSQVGCRFNCPFCSSGAMGFKRDLTPAEIITQVLFIEKNTGSRITNVVYMGIGEPFDNYDNVMKSIGIMVSPDLMKIGTRKITLSTSGIIPGINKLAETHFQVNLSISLHSADNRIRDKLVPINRKYPL